MNEIDPRTLDGRALMAYFLLGAIPRRGWPGRTRLIARRLAIAAAVLVGVVGLLWFGRLAVIVMWALAS